MKDQIKCREVAETLELLNKELPSLFKEIARGFNEIATSAVIAAETEMAESYESQIKELKTDSCRQEALAVEIVRQNAAKAFCATCQKRILGEFTPTDPCGVAKTVTCPRFSIDSPVYLAIEDRCTLLKEFVSNLNNS